MSCPLSVFKFQSGATALTQFITLQGTTAYFKFQSGATAFIRCPSLDNAVAIFKFQSGATALPDVILASPPCESL